MARVTRIVLDLALVSIKTVQPVVSNLWSTTKSAISNTRGKILVENRIVTFVENGLDKLTGSVKSKMIQIRNRQYEAELKYLEEEIKKTRDKIKEKSKGGRFAGKAMRPAVGTAWRYAKVEMAPPMTGHILNGLAGEKFEQAVARMTDTVLSCINTSIKSLDAAEAKKIKDKEATIRAQQEKMKVEAEMKRKEAEMLAKTKEQVKENAKEKTKETSSPSMKGNQDKNSQKSEIRETKDPASQKETKKKETGDTKARPRKKK